MNAGSLLRHYATKNLENNLNFQIEGLWLKGIFLTDWKKSARLKEKICYGSKVILTE